MTERSTRPQAGHLHRPPLPSTVSNHGGTEMIIEERCRHIFLDQVCSELRVKIGVLIPMLTSIELSIVFHLHILRLATRSDCIFARKSSPVITVQLYIYPKDITASAGADEGSVFKRKSSRMTLEQIVKTEVLRDLGFCNYKSCNVNRYHLR